MKYSKNKMIFMLITIFYLVNIIKAFKNKNTLETLNTLQALSQTLNKRQRYSESGDKCAKIFVQEGNTYYDCTDIKSPDGQDLKREWCYLETPKVGKKNWGYCKEILDWNIIRQRTYNEFSKVSQKVTENIRNSQSALEPIKKLFNEVLKLKQQHKTLDNKLLEMNEDFKTFSFQKNYLTTLKVQWSQLEKDCVFLQNEIEKKESEIEEEKKNSEISDDPFETQTKESDNKIEITKEYISKIEEILNFKINPLIQKQSFEKKTVPNDEDDFEDEELGSGVNAKYYDNIYFKGIPKVEILDEVNLELEGKSPYENINSDAYSVVFDGYIVPPINSEYIFILKTDDPECSIFINEKNVMDYSKNKEKVGILQKIIKGLLSFFGLCKKNINESERDKFYTKKMRLEGGRSYKILIKYSHDSFSRIDDEKAYAQLFWKSNFFTETKVEQIYLYPMRPKNSLKISVDSKIGVNKRLYKNDLAFKDSELFLIQDIPSFYEGLKSIKLNCKNKTENLNFEVNKIVNIFIAIPEQGFIDPPKDFTETGEFLSILSIEDNIYDYTDPNKEYPKKIYSTDSFTYKIYQRRISQGSHSINIHYNVQDINKIINSKRKKELYGLGGMLVFFGSDPQTSIHRSCGVEQNLISDPDKKSFKSCSANPGSTDCKDGFIINENSKWMAKSEESSWLQVDFNGEFEISKIIYKNNDPGEPKSPLIKIKFSTGEEKEYSIGNGKVPTLTWVVNPPIISSNVKFVYPSSIVKSGGKFEVYGSKCKLEDENEKEDDDEVPKDDDEDNNDNKGEKEDPTLFEDTDEDKKEVFSLDCYDDFELKGPLLKLKKKVDLKVRVFCQNSCENINKEIFGSGDYTTNSVICKSAYHSGIIDINGGYIDIQIINGLLNYKSEYKNKILSKSSKKTDFAMNFFKVDYSKPTFVEKKFKVPSVIRVKFAPINYKIKKTKEFLVDNGLEYGKTNNLFGWSENISENAKKMKSIERNGKNGCPNMISDTSIDFNPDKKSIWCKTTSCERVNWKIKVGKGKFKFKVFIFDPNNNYIINLQVNGRPLVETTKVNKNCLAEFEGEFNSNSKGFLVLTDECKKECNHARSKINFVEIKKIDEEVKDIDGIIEEKADLSNKLEKEDTDKSAFYGGRCDSGEIVENCLYDDFKSLPAKFCKDPYKLVQVDQNYKSGLQKGKVKCIKKIFLNPSECEKYCPGPCDKLICNA